MFKVKNKQIMFFFKNIMLDVLMIKENQSNFNYLT